jgi:outer membrane protein OmpA-like peptidoglycan-associated protein
VVLLPDDQGKTGAIVVTGAGSERVLSGSGQAVSVSAGSPPGQPFVLSEAEVAALAGPALRALPPPPAQFVFYFNLGAADLTEESRARLRETARTIRERFPVDVSVVGHTDTVGDKRYNYQLSLKRARAVAALLAAEGVDPSIMEITSHGKDNPLVPTGDQVPEPRNRRVEVTVR